MEEHLIMSEKFMYKNGAASVDDELINWQLEKFAVNEYLTWQIIVTKISWKWSLRETSTIGNPL
jgi:hypothetical protein